MKMPYRVMVYEREGNYFAQDSFGNLLQTINPDGDNAEPLTNPNTDPAPVLQAALNRQGDIYVADGSYNFTPDFAGLYVKSFSRITLAKDAKLIVSTGYSGEVFIFDSVQAAILEGGYYTEDGGVNNAQRNWTLIHFIGGPRGTGTFSNLVQNIRTWFVGTVIRLSAKTVGGELGFVNVNKFSNFSVYAYKIGIQFAETGFFNRNIFENLMYQTQPDLLAETGADRISGKANTFFNVYFIDRTDINGNELITGNIAQLSNNAENTLIIGGVLTFPPEKFVDEGVGTQIIDEEHQVTIG